MLTWEKIPFFKRLQLIQSHIPDSVPIFLDDFLLGLDWNMHRIVAHIEEKRVAIVILDQLNGLVSQAVGEIFTFRAILQRGHTPGAEISLAGHTPVASSHVDVKPLFVWIIRFFS